MVYKVSKGGVRSGNTLRGLRSLRTRRYLRQGCIVSQSNLMPKEVPKFLNSATDDGSLFSTLGSTDVLLSLNKKKRWDLPATVGHMIRSGGFKDSQTMVSLLERHKLKRKANCVSFSCNQGRIRHVAPGQRRYFSFKLDHIGSDESKRQSRRRKAKQGKHETVKIAEALTISGSLKTSVVSSKPEYRLQVYHPCPKSCSLTYNPKYTDVHQELGEDGMMEVKSNTKAIKSKKQHRKRFTFKEMKAHLEEIDADFSQNFSEDCDENYDNELLTENIKEAIETESSSDSESDTAKFQLSENILACLITKAENARLLCENVRVQPKKRSIRSHIRDQCPSEAENRSHIIYTSREAVDLQSRYTKLTETNATVYQYDTLESSRVILSSTETEPDKLRSRFGLQYAEAESEPRRFLINITEDVQNLLSNLRSAEHTSTFISYLMFIQDGTYDDGLETFKVFLNSNICPETLRISQSLPFERTSIEEIVNRIMGVLLDMKQEHQILLNVVKTSNKIMHYPLKFVSDVMGIDVTSFHARDELSRVSQTDGLQEKLSYSEVMDDVIRNLDAVIFCDICYENVNTAQEGSVSGTRLSQCGHSVCDSCWKEHIRSKDKNGAVKVMCPGYGCDVTVGPVTLLSLLHVSEVSHLFQRACEELEESSPASKWCPDPDCGRMIKIDNLKEISDVSLDVTCACGQEFCFLCLSQPHWPAKCQQAQDYHTKLVSQPATADNSEDRSSENLSRPQSESVEIVEIIGRICPKCSKFIQKDGGCNYMYCKCTYFFCWNCMKEANINHVRCMPDPSYVAKLTRKVLVRHMGLPKLFSAEKNTPGKIALEKLRLKTNLYNKARQQRSEGKNHNVSVSEITKRVVHHAQKDLIWKKEILSVCGVDVNNVDIFGHPLATHVTAFLGSFVELKQALHHVAEFTFVLLQDTPDSVDKRRILKLANDLSGYCCFISSILELGKRQDVQTAIRRLQDIRIWARRALSTLVCCVDELKC